MTIPLCAAADPDVRKPSFSLPAGTVDTHFHVFGPAALYPYTPDRSYTPPEAPLAAYEHLAETLGFARSVIVQPSVYGLDNRCSLDAVAQSRLPMRAVLVLDPQTSDDELERYHRLGARGVRLNLLFKGGVGMAAARQLADRIRPFGWHIQFLADVSAIPDLKAEILRLNLPVVFDHLGHVPASKGPSDAGFRALLDLVRDGAAWVKLSGAYRVTALTETPYRDVIPFARALVQANPHQLLWGTDWPHPSIPVRMPNDTDLLEAFPEWVEDAGLRETICVRNPERLYGFDPL